MLAFCPEKGLSCDSRPFPGGVGGGGGQVDVVSACSWDVIVLELENILCNLLTFIVKKSMMFTKL